VQNCTPFLSSGLYRRFWIPTRSAFRLVDLSLTRITTGEDLHLALKQTIHLLNLLYTRLNFFVNDNF